MHRILMVEDDSLIEETLEQYLLSKGYEITGIAASVAEAKALYQQEQPDAVLIDIELAGEETGIDFVRFLRRQPDAPPFIFVTAHWEGALAAAAIRTCPAGYLCKPIQKDSLYTTLEIALYNSQDQGEKKSSVRLFNGQHYYLVPVDDILYLEADHIYIRVHLVDNQQLLPRMSLRELLEQLPEDQFVQTHRSYVVNIRRVREWEQEQLFVENTPVPMSRSRRKEVLTYLNKSNV